jgi:activator of HSP90 ATPase
MKNLKQRHSIMATVEEVYIALTNPLTIELWSGYTAEFTPVEGTEFSLWEGDITGKNLKLVENELIQQQWYFEGQQEDSIVTIRLKKEGNNTVAELTQDNIPDEVYDEMVIGWKKYYFGAIKKYFE